jgi:hypothetical protein
VGVERSNFRRLKKEIKIIVVVSVAKLQEIKKALGVII